MRRYFHVVAILAFFGVASYATVFLIPTDDALVDRADAIAVGTISRIDNTSAARGGIDTIVTLRVEEAIRGDLPCEITIREQGGILGKRIELSDTAPLYGSAVRVLVFLERTDEGWTTSRGALGKFDFVPTAAGGEALVRSDRFGEIFGFDEHGRRYEERTRDATGFLSYVRARVAGERRSAGYLLRRDVELRPQYVHPTQPDTTFSASSYTTEVCTGAVPPVCFPARWFVFDTGGTVTFKSNGEQPGAESAATAIGKALSAWSDDPGSNIDFAYGGTTSNSWNAEDGVNVIAFNQAIGSLATSVQRAGDIKTFDDQDWAVFTECDLALSASALFANPTFFEEIITHETGHNLGLRHSDKGHKINNVEQSCDPATMECTSAAIMRQVTPSGNPSALFGANLQPWEVHAVDAIYPETGPVISSLSVTSGPTFGGTALVITGQNFANGAGLKVEFGGTLADVVFVNSTTLNVITPERATAGPVDVVVTNPDAKAGTKSNAYAYTLTPAVITSVTPNSGPTGGGTAVTISGDFFFGSVGVTFGETAAADVVRTDSHTITCTTPVHAAGAVDVVVTNGDTGTATQTSGFTYQALPPTITSLDVTSGPQTGGTAVTITGTNFLTGASVDFGGALATHVIVVSSTSITLKTPAHSVGVVDVTVTNPGDLSDTIAGAFEFTPVVLPPGDVNGTGAIDAGDVVYLVNFLFGGGPVPVGSGDVNGDTEVNVLDLFYLVNYLFASGAAPAP